MNIIWESLPKNAQRFLILIGSLSIIAVIGLQFHVGSQGDTSATYPKGFRGGTCTIESEHLLVGYSGYFISTDYAIPSDAMSAMPVPVLCGKIPSPGTLAVTIDLLYPESAREWPLTMTLAKTEDNKPTKTLLTIPPEIHKSGIITQVLSIDETGEYGLYLSGKNTDQVEFVLEIPITVGTQWHETIVEFWPMLLLIVSVPVLYNIRKIFS